MIFFLVVLALMAAYVVSSVVLGVFWATLVVVCIAVAIGLLALIGGAR